MRALDPGCDGLAHSLSAEETPAQSICPETGLRDGRSHVSLAWSRLCTLCGYLRRLLLFTAPPTANPFCDGHGAPRKAQEGEADHGPFESWGSGDTDDQTAESDREQADDGKPQRSR